MVAAEPNSTPRMQYRGRRDWLEQVERMGELPIVVDVSADLRARLKTKFPHIFSTRERENAFMRQLRCGSLRCCLDPLAGARRGYRAAETARV